MAVVVANPIVEWRRPGRGVGVDDGDAAAAGLVDAAGVGDDAPILWRKPDLPLAGRCNGVNDMASANRDEPARPTQAAM